LRIKADGIASLEVFDSAANGGDHTGAVAAEDARQAGLANGATLAKLIVGVVERCCLQTDDDIVRRLQVGIGRLFETQLFDAAMVVNSYRFQSVSSENINWVSKNENQSQREVDYSDCT